MTTSKREHIFVPGFIVVNKFEVSQYIYQGNNLVYTLFWLKNSKISQHTSHQIKNNKLTQKKQANIRQLSSRPSSFVEFVATLIPSPNW